MPVIRPVSDLRNKTPEIEEICIKERKPVFITKNGNGHLVIMSQQLFEEQQALLDLYDKLDEAEEQSRAGKRNTNPRRCESGKRILVMTAVPAEREAVLRGLHSDKRFDVLVAGVGPVSAAVNTAKVLATTEYGLVVSAGIGGGFSNRAEVGSIVVANEIVAADLGVETPEGFSSIDELGFGSTRIQVDASLVNVVTEALIEAGLPVKTGPVLTVSTVTGTAESASELAARVPGATAEAMEGYGVAFAANDHGVPILEIRAISNLVGPRDRTAWRIKEALDVLEAACSVLSRNSL